MGLTRGQKEVLDAIVAYKDSNHRTPSYRDVAAYIGKSLSWVYRVIQILIEKGVVRHEYGAARCLEVLV